MKFREAIQRSIKNYYDGILPEKAIAASDEEFIYTPEYFDELLDEEDSDEDAK